MMPLVWMAGVSLVAWGVTHAAGGDSVHPEALFGVLGPLGSASGTWVAARRAFAESPQHLTQTMVRGFGVKLVFFVVYVSFMLGAVGLRPAPFALSFVGSLVVLYGIEAMFLQRLMDGAAPARYASRSH